MTPKATKGAAHAAKRAGSDHDALTEYRHKRDFSKTSEPEGTLARREGRLRFVVQKHHATQLHFDLRLELDGTMKSWAVPKGPSADPSVKRLAMQVEDHPISYNTFEGTIPEGEYGGGTVMLWDQGTYTPEPNPAAPIDSDDDEDIARAGYDKGDFKVTFHGERLQGSYVLVRTRGFGGRSSKPSWLLIKHRDDYVKADDEPDLTDRFVTSVSTGRSMDEIGGRAHAPPGRSMTKKTASKKTATKKPAKKTGVSPATKTATKKTTKTTRKHSTTRGRRDT